MLINSSYYNAIICVSVAPLHPNDGRRLRLARCSTIQPRGRRGFSVKKQDITVIRVQKSIKGQGGDAGSHDGWWSCCPGTASLAAPWHCCAAVWKAVSDRA